MRIGHGFDVHKFGGKGPITLGGVAIPHDEGLIAHSDGDVALHALCDSLLGALALGDIGTHFPDSSASFAGIDSLKLLKNVYQKVMSKGYKIGNLDITIVAQTPKISPYTEQMRTKIAATLDTDIDNVNIKATTTEKLGYTGRKEGIATYAVVLLRKE